MVYERDPNGPLDGTLHTWRVERVEGKEYTCEVVERMEKARKRMKIEVRR